MSSKLKMTSITEYCKRKLTILNPTQIIKSIKQTRVPKKYKIGRTTNRKVKTAKFPAVGK